MKLFAAVLQIKQAKAIVIEDSSHKYTCNDPTRESEKLLLEFLMCQVWNVLNCLLNILSHKGGGIRGSLLSYKLELQCHDNISSVKVTKS